MPDHPAARSEGVVNGAVGDPGRLGHRTHCHCRRTILYRDAFGGIEQVLDGVDAWARHVPTITEHLLY
ncbi:Uncharacterised protein [Mycobacteroides abscessus subsp. abscessus]|nr:Uncharacterised protein [Mycobacteroides abscessus subsp. abscessus]